MNKTVKGLVTYFDSLAYITGEKSLRYFNEEEMKIEADIAFNYLKFKNETYNKIVDDLDSFVNAMSDSMYKEEKNKDFELALAYSLIATNIVSKILENIKEEISNKKDEAK